jgi:hypothetical protein
VSDITNPISVISGMTPVDWGFVLVASALVLGLLGPRLLRDIKGWVS